MPNTLSEDFDVLELLTTLSDKGLVLADTSGNVPHFLLSETIRQYAKDLLIEHGAEEVRRDRHLEWFVDRAELAEPHLIQADQIAWHDQLEFDRRNFTAALEWSRSSSERAEKGLRLAGAIWRFWWIRGHLAEGRKCLAEALSVTASLGSTEARSKALLGSAVLASRAGDYSSALALAEESLMTAKELGLYENMGASLNVWGFVLNDLGEIEEAKTILMECVSVQRSLGNRHGLANALNNLGNVLSGLGDFSGARDVHLQTLVIRREMGDRAGIAISLNNLGAVAARVRDWKTARALHEECLVVFRELQEPSGVANALNSLGWIEHSEGQYSTAIELHKEGLCLQRKIGDKLGISNSLEYLAASIAREGEVGLAATVWGAAERIRDDIHSPLNPNDRRDHEIEVAAARVTPSNDDFDVAWERGRALALEAAVDLVLA